MHFQVAVTLAYAGFCTTSSERSISAFLDYILPSPLSSCLCRADGPLKCCVIGVMTAELWHSAPWLERVWAWGPVALQHLPVVLCGGLLVVPGVWWKGQTELLMPHSFSACYQPPRYTGEKAITGRWLWVIPSLPDNFWKSLLGNFISFFNDCTDKNWGSSTKRNISMCTRNGFVAIVICR